MCRLINIVLFSLLLPLSVMAAQLRDPTLPPAGVASQSGAVADSGSALVLHSIVQGPGQEARAVINQQVYRQGDTVQGVRITAIGRSEVTLADGRRLRMFPSLTEPDNKRKP